MARPASDKRERLIGAAIGAFHQHGVRGTSLGDVARAADIAPGNVYYHFRTKDALTRAVVAEWAERLAAVLTECEAAPDPAARLHRFLGRALANRGFYAAAGCPIAGLSRDLRQTGLADEAARGYALELDWLKRQFRACGAAPAEAKAKAVFLLAGLQGSFALAYAAHDESLVAATVEQLRAWLDGAAASGAA